MRAPATVYQDDALLPTPDSPTPRERIVTFAPSVVVARGQLIAQVIDPDSADVGKWRPYDDDGIDAGLGHDDGRRTARGISKRAFITNSVGAVAYVDQAAALAMGTVPTDSEIEVHWAPMRSTAEVYLSGCFRVEDLVGFDVAAIADLGRLQEGYYTAGQAGPFTEAVLVIA